MDKLLLVLVGAFVIVFSLFWIHEKQDCASKGGLLLRSFDCVKVVYIK